MLYNLPQFKRSNFPLFYDVICCSYINSKCDIAYNNEALEKVLGIESNYLGAEPLNEEFLIDIALNLASNDNLLCKQFIYERAEYNKQRCL